MNHTTTLAGDESTMSTGENRYSGAAGPILIALGLLLASVVVGSRAFTPESLISGDVFALNGSPVEIAWQIFVRNATAALLLFSGYALAGTTTVMGLVFVGTWVGAGSAAVAIETGLGNISPLVALYLPLEFTGLVLASAGGLVPVVRFAGRAFSDGDRPRPRIAGHVLAARLGLTGLLLILLGAVVECLVIVAQQ